MNLQAILDYMTACHHIYERGILNKISVHKPDGFIIQEMEEGHRYLVPWMLQDDGTHGLLSELRLLHVS